MATVLVLVLILFLPPTHPVLTQSQLGPYFLILGDLSLSMIPRELKISMRNKKEHFFRYWKGFPDKQLRPGEGDEKRGDALRMSKIEQKTPR